MTIPGSQLREAIGRPTVRFRVSRLCRITARPFGLSTADAAVMLGDERPEAHYDLAMDALSAGGPRHRADALAAGG
jgi:hypothetical protein